MAQEITVAIIGAVGTVVAALATYLFTKNEERQAELRQAKMKRYDDLVGCLTQLVQNRAGIRKVYDEDRYTGGEFIDAYYRAGAYASKSVLDACHKLLEELESLEIPLKSIAEIETSVDGIYNAIRKDTLDPKEPNHEFKAYHIREKKFSTGPAAVGAPVSWSIVK